MGSKSKTLHDLFLHQLRDLHYAERHGGKMLGKLAKAASAAEVKAALSGFAETSHAQVEQLDAVFDALDRKPHTVPCPAMQGVIEEAKDLLDDFEDSGALDAGLLASAQAIAAYGIARCAALRVWSGRLGLAEPAAVIAAMLDDKRRIATALDRLADDTVAAIEDDTEEAPVLTLKAAALKGLG